MTNKWATGEKIEPGRGEGEVGWHGNWTLGAGGRGI
jgi:hypothetical protein